MKKIIFFCVTLYLNMLKNRKSQHKKTNKNLDAKKKLHPSTGRHIFAQVINVIIIIIDANKPGSKSQLSSELIVAHNRECLLYAGIGSTAHFVCRLNFYYRKR